MEIHWKAALQVKGFLKFVEMVSYPCTQIIHTHTHTRSVVFHITRTLLFFFTLQAVALIALSLVAGSWVIHNGTCIEFHRPDNVSAKLNGTLTVEAYAHYPFGSASVAVKGLTRADEIFQSTNTTDLNTGFTQASQFFVAWGALTIFYGIIALGVYIFTTANIQLEWLVNYLVLSVSWGGEEDCMCRLDEMFWRERERDPHSSTIKLPLLSLICLRGLYPGGQGGFEQVYSWYV